MLAFSPLAASVQAQSSDSMEFQLSRTSGPMGALVTIDGNVTLRQTSAASDTMRVSFGSIPVGAILVLLHNGTPNGTYIAKFNVPLVDEGSYNVSVSDTFGGSYSQAFTVTYGVNNLIGSLQNLQNQNSSLTSISAQLSSLERDSPNSAIQSQSLLLEFAVILESTIAALVAILIILQIRDRRPRVKPEEVEIIDS